MDDYQLELYCNAHPLCDCNCMKCPGMAQKVATDLGWDEDDNEDEEYNDDEDTE